MSKRYEDLTDAEKLVNSTHFPGKTGPTLKRVLEAVQHQLDNLILSAAGVVNDSFQISNSWGGDVEKVGNMMDVVRFVNETDDAYRNRVIVEAATFETVTVDAILTLYETLLGKAPTITEPFITRVYQSGDSVEDDEGGVFTVLFDVEMTKRSERLRVDSSGTSVTVTDDTIVVPVTDAVSVTTSVASETFTTTLYAQDVTNFPDWGEFIIEDEWIDYDSKQASPAAFLNCNRGLYDSVPDSHNTDVTITEGSTKAFLYRTNTQVYSSQSGTIIYLKDGPYDWDTYLDVQYKITNADAKDEFDTPQELGAALDQLQVIGYDFKAAGINANIIVGYSFRAWFSVFRENITITDYFKMIVSGIKFPEIFDFGTPPATQAFFDSTWDTSEWDTGLWSEMFWNGSSWEWFGVQEWEYVIITGT